MRKLILILFIITSGRSYSQGVKLLIKTDTLINADTAVIDLRFENSCDVQISVHKISGMVYGSVIFVMKTGRYENQVYSWDLVDVKNQHKLILCTENFPPFNKVYVIHKYTGLMYAEIYQRR